MECWEYHGGWDGSRDVDTERECLHMLTLVDSTAPRIQALPLEGHSLLLEGQLASLHMAIATVCAF